MSVQEAARAAAVSAARSAILTSLSRVASVITPLIAVPFIMWLVSTTNDSKEQIAVLTKRVEILENARTALDQTINVGRTRRDDQLNNVMQRLSSVESTTIAINQRVTAIDQKIDTLIIQRRTENYKNEN